MVATPAEYMPARYWEKRAGWKYYAEIRRLLEHYSPGMALLDVGGWDTPVATWGRFARRYTCDLVKDPGFPGVSSHVGDFLQYELPERMSVITCCQVLEHLTDEAVIPFAAKLRASADIAIVSVPFMWPAGREPGHRQDPIDVRKLERIMGGKPIRITTIIDDRRARLLGVWAQV